MLPTPLRNQPCPCGSGQRYKHCCGAAAGLSPGDVAPVLSAMTSALREQRAGNLAAAERLYREVLDRQPDEADSLHMLGVIYYQTQHLWEAFQHIRRALDLTDWQVPSMRYNFGLVLAMLSADPMPSVGPSGEQVGAKATMLKEAKARLLQASKLLGLYRLEERAAPLVIPRAVNPKISIVIPAFDHHLHTFSCVKSIVAHTSGDEYEVVVVDDCSAEPVASALRDVQGWQLLRNESNLGFVQSCNRGALAARGDIVVFLNNDTLVTPGWLDALVAPLSDASVGLVGAKLIYPDGRLQEAGGIIWPEGASVFGRNDDAGRPEYNYVRTVDYCSGACLAIRRRDFLALDGFDMRFSPGYYEDTDLAMRVRENGKRVVYQPDATIVHFEGVSSGTDANVGQKRYQLVNQAKFVERWKSQLAARSDMGTNPRLEKDRGCRARVLFVDGRMPAPDRDAGSMRLVGMMRILRQLGCKVTFAAQNMEFAAPYGRHLQQDGIEVLHLPYCWTIAEILADRGSEFDMVVVSHYPIAKAILADVRRHAPRALLVFDTVDLHYLREEREAAVTGRPDAMRRAAVSRQQELAVAAAADVTLVVSPYERTLLEQELPGRAIRVVSDIHTMHAPAIDFESRRDLFFIGGYDHTPNVDAVQWFAREIWSKVRYRLPDVKLFLIGSKMPPAVAALAGEGIEPLGHLPDLTPYLERCRISIAPLRYGAGVKGKINLAQSWGIPVVATTVAVEGMQLEHLRDVLVADTPQDFADAVVRLYTDRTLWTVVAEGGRANVIRHFSPEAATGAIEQLVTAALGNRQLGGLSTTAADA
jgi:GT2 family glycosyltransferase/glycosyltransferase involved in cell wall biosynthesis